MTKVKEIMTSKNTKMLLFASLIAAMVLPFSAMNMAYAATQADKTDYVAMWKIIDEQIEKNEEKIEKDRVLLGTTTSLSEKQSIEKTIRDKEAENTKLDQRIDELERLNILSYKLDPAAQKIFDDAETILIEKYLDDTSSTYIGANGVSDITVDTKQRKIIVLLDIEQQLLNASTTQDVVNIVSDITSSVSGVDVDVQFGKIVDISCTSRTSTCNPAKGGVQIQRMNSGGGSTLAFSATHGTHGDGFVIAKHEAKKVGNTIVQPKSGTSFGTVKVLGSGFCDCAFVKTINGKSVEDKIWAPEAGSTYPIGTRVGSSSHTSGTFLTFSGVGSGTALGDIVSVDRNNRGTINLSVSGGDSGGTLFKPLRNGNADVYGMVYAKVAKSSSSDPDRAYYMPWHHIKSNLSLTD